ncbi:penicillin-binding protein 2 [Prochlorococcus marinus]|uniref:Penicillin-binding protein 2 n=1 Tax=Prochlorococcus marinus XMU1408 TaxID=2213228 RepID=A0A318R3L6_PROMR|nr:penicillin-binding protein 2 [Prochlorococcus marinus]MBW3041045.1 penicillin-binding protein 2 [Prochlorococcus marinus str. XMU1408]PYE03654.1 penicillin-binding protein 2 [Prochlorococcus marinus XMU1408]
MKKKEKFYLSSKKHVGAFNQPLVFFLFICFVFSITGFRLFWIQIINGSYYKKLSEENRIKLIANPPIRGRLLDRNGKVLADNKLFYSLSVQPRLITNSEWIDLRRSLSDLLNVSTKKLEIAFNRNNLDTPYKKILLTDLSEEQVVRFKEQENNLYGAQIDIDLIRNYPYKSLAAHALGYTQLITQKEFSKLSEQGYKLSDRIGRKGIEAAFESELRGKWGGEMLEIDAIGTVQRSLGLKLPRAGKDIRLTLDLDLQRTAEKVLSDKVGGAIVALDPRTGAIRAIASQPTFDLNFFSQPFTSFQYDSLFLSKKDPLLSRAFNAYDPGSTWKPVTAIAGMESGKVPASRKLNTVPCITYGSHCFPEYNRRGFGWIGYEDALRVSSNTFFYQVGVWAGSNALYDAAIKLGFDNYTGIETIFDENKGLVGNKEWAAEGRGWGKPGETPWIVEDLASASIGQSVVQVTPLQLARAYAVFANGGYLITPHLVDAKKNWRSEKYLQKVDIKDSTLDTIRRGLRKVVTNGTGIGINLDTSVLPPVAGKTGTAEDSSGGADHAWFAGFAPYDSGEIVIVAFAQNTPGGGSVHALPMARKILETWYEQKSNDE